MEWSEGIGRAIEYIESHITEELTIAKIAGQAFLSPYYFQKGFPCFVVLRSVNMSKNAG